MAEGIATRSSRGHRTICLPISEDAYSRIVNDPDGVPAHCSMIASAETPELFPPNFAHGYELKDDRMSVKQELPIRRILLKDDTAYSIRPSFLMPYMTAHVADVEGPLFLRKFGVPFWALAHVFGARPDVLVSPGVRAGPVQRRGDHRPQGGVARASAGRRASSSRSTARRSTSPRPSATGAAWGRNRPRRRGPTS